MDFSAHISRLCADICLRLPELAHIDTRRMLFCVSRSRTRDTHGLQARIVPLRFDGGSRETERKRGRFVETFRMPQLHHEGVEILYLVYLMFPRFLRQDSQSRLETLIHELYHVSERFDGDIRRFAGRNFAHGSSRSRYNRIISALAQRYLAAAPDPELTLCLHLKEEDWAAGRLKLSGLQMPLPRAKLITRVRA